MKEFVKRIVKEKEELDIKLTNLESFMETKEYLDLTLAEIVPLLKQRRVMKEYITILEERIEYYKKYKQRYENNIQQNPK